ncbi:lytic transglycosylase domain-containing protein [Actinoplanes sp. NPDC051346]|uniref:aggregation-promoting factor C-terminal-like domain-containing protein n=1 Tax=Actinoplanes sp. NPDC051346 TaxID=3155048 RepID=UPI00343A2EAD
MNRLWSRVGIRAASVGLLVAGVIGGVYIGQDREVQAQSAQAQLVVQANNDEMALLKERHNEHAAVRAYQRRAEGEAASKAAIEAKAAAAKARKLEKKAIEKAAEKKAAESKKSSGNSGTTVPFDGEIPASCEEFKGNRATGCAVMLDKGFEIDQFPCLEKLWEKESGWNHRAQNPSSGAYGIPQSLPGSKMASAGDDWETNPATQIRWGLGYIKGRYNTPCGAWSHSQNVGWY